METAKNGHMSESFGSGTAAVISPKWARLRWTATRCRSATAASARWLKLYDTLTGIQLRPRARRVRLVHEGGYLIL